MNPWNIIGWGILALIALAVAFVAWAYVSTRATRYWKHLVTRNIPPGEGQTWDQDGTTLRIGPRWPKGHFSIHAGSASWGETDDEWRERVRNRRLFLTFNPPKGEADNGRS